MHILIYLIAFFEGFTTLSIEIIALRKFTPLIGTNSISTSVFLGVILLALSYGYYIGGKISAKKKKSEIRNIIIANMFFATCYYLFFTFIIDTVLLQSLLEVTQSYFWSLLISAMILFFVPIFLASQTIPLLSELLKGSHSGEKIGKLLFYSTIGSFLGSLVTSSVLFPNFGIQNSIFINIIILSAIGITLGSIKFKKSYTFTIACICILILSIYGLFSSKNVSASTLFKQANAYHTIQVENISNNRRVLFQNGGYASGIHLSTKESFFSYIKEIKKQILSREDKKILIIGAAGFSLPHELSLSNTTEQIDVVDVDPSLKNISEKYFLQKKLSDKIVFHALPSRFFITNNIKMENRYDSIVVDVYIGDSLPPQTLTHEFFSDLKQLSGHISINIITDTPLETQFSKSLIATLQSAWGDLYYRDVNNGSRLKGKTNFVMTNIATIGYKQAINSKADIYYDDKNSIEIDLFGL